MSILLPSERLSSSHSEFLRSLELCDRSLSLLVELALLPSLQRVIFRACRSLLGVPHSEEWFLRSPELLMGRASTAPLTQRVTYEHAAPLWASEFPLILGNECSALQSLLSVELTLLPSPRGSPMSIPLPSERLSFLSF